LIADRIMGGWYGRFRSMVIMVVQLKAGNKNDFREFL